MSPLKARKRKSQSAFEYLLLLAGLIVLVILLALLLRGSIFGKSTNEINQSISTIKAIGSAFK